MTDMDEYLNEQVYYGGSVTSRGAMIQNLWLTAKDWTEDPAQQQLLVDRFLHAFDWKQGPGIARRYSGSVKP